MKNIHKKIIAIVATLTLVLGCSVMAYAAGPQTSDDIENSAVEISPRSNNYELSGVPVTGKAWTRVAWSNTGFGCNVQINPLNTTIGGMSVRMLDRNENIIWQETEAIPYNKVRVFECGTDVFYIEVKCVDSNAGSSVSSWQTTRAPGIYNYQW